MNSFKNWLKITEEGDFDAQLSGAIQGKSAMLSADPKIGNNPSAIADKIIKDTEVKNLMSKSKNPVTLNPAALQKTIKTQLDTAQKDQGKATAGVQK